MKAIELISKIHLKLKEVYNNFKNDNLWRSRNKFDNILEN